MKALFNKLESLSVSIRDKRSGAVILDVVATVTAVVSTAASEQNTNKHTHTHTNILGDLNDGPISDA